SHCSYRSPTQPVPAEIDPRNVLNRLFGKSDKVGSVSRANPLDRQMLDRVLGGARDLRRTLAKGDRLKLDEYLDSVRAVERRIAAIESRQKENSLEKSGLRIAGQDSNQSAPIEISIPEGDKRSEYMQVMCDLTVLAFQTDTTRVSTYIGSTPNGVSYPELGFTDQHHSQTHHENQEEMVGKVAAITKFNIDQFAYMVNKMAGLQEGDGTLLDHCIMMWGSGLEDGNNHTRKNLPFILAGRGGGTVDTGRFLPDVRGNQGDLLTTLLSCAGVPLDRPIGIATKQIEDLKSTSIRGRQDG
ncbi:MAG: DUF1552 domain-containing protein, partial [Planctomycetota bacterium]|nr:DUF1552 domain-containing protein [Planctomycetota bacterium]